MFWAFVANRTIWNCYEPLQLARTATKEAPLVYGGSPATRLHRREFTPNSIRFSVTTDQESDRVFLNQNYIGGWHSDAGPCCARRPGRCRPARDS
jgi:hypothetical protein